MSDDNGETGHIALHDCDHDCACFWCRVSRREPFEPIIDSVDIGS